MTDIEKRFLQDVLKRKGADEYLQMLQFVNAKIPIPFLEFEFANLADPELKKSIVLSKEYVAKIKAEGLLGVKGKGALIHGGSGSGKTALACVILKEMIRLRVEGRFELFEAFLNKILDRQTDDIDVDFLVIDGFGDAPTFKESKMYGWTIGRLDAFLRERYFQGRPTVITTRLPKERFNAVFPESVTSFLTESAFKLDHSLVKNHRNKK